MRLTAAQSYVALLSAATVLAGAWFIAPQLNPLSQDGLAPLSVSLEHVDVSAQRVRVLGYERAAFGSGWASVGACTVRDAVMAAHFSPATTGLTGLAGLPPDCTTHGTAVDLYTGETLAAEDVEIDHVFPLAAAWDLGAYEWDTATRLAFANDPANLVATSKTANQEKSDQLPHSWLPSAPRSRCWYVRRLADIAATYVLQLPEPDVNAMRRQCWLQEGFRGTAALVS